MPQDPVPQDGVNVTVTEYLVTIWPRGHDCGEAARWCLVVRDRGGGRWAVEQSRSHGFPKVVLSRSGQWVLDSPGGDPRCRFSLPEALDAARRHARQRDRHRHPHRPAGHERPPGETVPSRGGHDRQQWPRTREEAKEAGHPVKNNNTWTR